MEDEVKNVLVTIINPGTLKPLLETCGKTKSLKNNKFFLQKKLNGNQQIKIVQWNSRSLRSKFPEFEQRHQNIDIITLSET
jgi:hypothetical protein